MLMCGYELAGLYYLVTMPQYQSQRRVRTAYHHARVRPGTHPTGQSPEKVRTAYPTGLQPSGRGPLPQVSCPVSGCWRSFDASGRLFSWGFTVERMTMNLFSRSNQNGAPNEMAKAVISQPIIGTNT